MIHISPSQKVSHKVETMKETPTIELQAEKFQLNK